MSHRWLIAVSGVAHVAVAAGLFVTGVWHIERLHADNLHVDLSVSPPPPPAPAGGPKSAVPSNIDRKTPRPTPHVPVQPTTKQPEPPAPGPQPEEPGGGGGSGDPTATGTCTENCGPAEAAAPVCGNASVEAGEQCDDGNTSNGDGCSSTCQREPKPEPPRPIVDPRVFRGLRTSGETQIHPSATTQTSMIREGKSHVEAVFKVCLGTDGSVASVELRKPTGYDEYDEALRSAVRGWRYQPYLINGAAVPACSYVNFTYTIR